MIDAKTLKKHNLKAVPFSCIGEGETFYYGATIIAWAPNFADLERRLIEGEVFYADDSEHEAGDIAYFLNATVYIPVWRPTKELTCTNPKK